MLGWIGNAMLFVAVWQLGNKRRWAFLLTFAGDMVWLVASLRSESEEWAAMVFSCVVFGALALRNWWVWGRQ